GKANSPDQAMPHACKLYEPRGREEDCPSGGNGGCAAGLALSRHAYSGGPVRHRASALLSAATQSLRGWGRSRRRIGPHAKDRLVSRGQSVSSVPRDVGDADPESEMV